MRNLRTKNTPHPVKACSRPVGSDRFHTGEFESQLKYLLSRQTTLTITHLSALDTAIKSRELRRWIRAVWDLEFDTHISLTAIHLYSAYLNEVGGLLGDYRWQGYACVWIAFKMERDDYMTDTELHKIVPPGGMDRVISAELDVSTTLGYRFSHPKVSEFAYVLLGMVEPEHTTVFM